MKTELIIFRLQSVGGWRNTAATKALAKPCLAGLAWSCAVVTQGAVEEEGRRIVDVSSLACHSMDCYLKLSFISGTVNSGLGHLFFWSGQAG